MVMGKLRIGGTWSGALEVELDEWTVPMLREEVANRSGSGGPQSINLICSGRVLKDGDGTHKLSQLGVKHNAKILASRASVDQTGKSIKDEFLAEEERANRISRLKSAATALASRHADGSLPVEDFNLELENQSGEKVQMGSETDQRAIMMGLMLHANAKALIRRQQYKDALEVLTMGEEAFSLCDPKLIEMVDNVSILQIDMVWCYFMLRDITWLSVAGVRLFKARKGIEKSHGKESSRLRVLQGGRYPELALYLRLELLEAVVAYHSGEIRKSRDALASAQAKYKQLLVPDDALSLLMSMGYKEHESKRALRMNNLDVGSAVDFLVEERAKKAQKREEDRQRQKEILEQKQYGTTPLKKAVDIKKVNYLASIGFEKELAAEALRRNENDTQKALDELTNPVINTTLQNEIITRKRKKLSKTTRAASESLVSMGFDKATVDTALRMFGGNQEEALNYLVSVPPSTAAGALNTSAAPPVADEAENTAVADDDNTGGGESSNGVADDENTGGGESSNGNQEEVKDRDVEMEDEITVELQNADAYSDYDIDVTKEGEAINEYMALLNSVHAQVA